MASRLANFRNKIGASKDLIKKEEPKNLQNRSISTQYLPEACIQEVSTKLASSKDISKIAVVEITNTDISGPGSLNDPAMGPALGDYCVTCGNIYKNCMGHMGRINVPKRFINPAFHKYVLYVLNSICWSCSKLLLNDIMIEKEGLNRYTGESRLKHIAKSSLNKKCISVANPDPDVAKCSNIKNIVNSKVLKTSGVVFYKLHKDDKDEQTLSVEELYIIFKAISDEDAATLGFTNGAHPVNFIVDQILVTPPCQRPNTFTQSGVQTISDQTKSYSDIIKNINLLKNAKNSSEQSTHMMSIIDSYKKLVFGKDNTLGLTESLVGKFGLIRGCTTGKNISNMARTVLSGNPDLPFGWLNVPREFQNRLLYPVHVTTSNLNNCLEFLKNGMVSRVKKYKGLTVNAKHVKTLNIGDIIYRWTIDGDIIIFNRQPTLHRHGLMAFYVKLWDQATIGLNPMYTTMFNADFDGDEGSLIVPAMEDKLHGLLDALGLMHVKNCLVSYTNNIAYGLVQDNIAGLYLLSQPETVIPKYLFDNVYNFIGKDWLNSLYRRLEKHHIKPNSGRAFVSMLFPENFYYNKNKVVIIDGVLIDGSLTKTSVGNSSTNIIKYLYNLNPEYAYDFITNASYMTNEYLKIHPISMGIKDCVVFDRKSKTEIDVINSNIAEMKEAVNNVTNESDKKVLLNKIKELEDSLITNDEKLRLLQTQINLDVAALEDAKNNTNNINERIRLEAEIIDKLNVSKTVGIDLTNNVLATSNLALAIKAKVKGNEFNVGSIAGLIGQVIVSGNRLNPLSIYYPNYKTDIRSRGYVGTSYSGTMLENGNYYGLSVTEFVAIASATREGLASTSLKTAIVGEISRTIRTLMQNVMLMNDGTVRFNHSNIIETSYIFDPSKLLQTNLGYPSFIDIQSTIESINSKYE